MLPPYLLQCNPMDSKLIWVGMIAGSTIGGLIPSLWGDSLLSLSSVVLTALGGLMGIWLAFRFNDY